ncbi:MAG: glycogen/starch/alpha-glucan phosphorylase [Chloroflexi bacterium]|nr:glycogen/starch/alpha-glucan phosphorylase [Chloroflexota bacterium]
MTEPAAHEQPELETDLRPAVQELVSRYLRHLTYGQAKDLDMATKRDQLVSLCMAVRDRLIEKMLATRRQTLMHDTKVVNYLSLEFLLGRLLEDTLINLGFEQDARLALRALDLDLDELREFEPDAGLGNGGLGRLAACYLESMTTLGYPAYGYGIRYDFGMFRQDIVNGEQVERPDAWLTYGNPWEILRADETVSVQAYGQVEERWDGLKNRPVWASEQAVLGVPYDIPIAGYGGETVNPLRLWSSRATNEFQLEVFNQGDYVAAVREKALAETISRVLYPSDAVLAGRELRLVQEYFFVACSLADILRRYRQNHRSFDALPDRVAMQLNDTHPALAVAELMRLLVDEEGLSWEWAWKLTVPTIGYTNHTLLPEALERWPVSLFRKVLPRHLEIVYEINHLFLEKVSLLFSKKPEKLNRVSLIEEGPEQQVRMAHLAVVGSHRVNGVAELHSRLLVDHLLPDFAELWPERFVNVTNGVTPRRWLLHANPGLSQLISERIGRGWVTDLERLRDLEPYADDADFQAQFRAVKRANKEKLAALILDRTGVEIDTGSLLSVQIKRLHEYKRQHLNALHVLSLYQAIKNNPSAGHDVVGVPRTFLFAAKAAPGYFLAKRIIRLVTRIGELVNGDPEVNPWLRVVFLPDYSVSLAEQIIPAADLSEQISMAGKEASGTGNMKLALNGALTIGTLDGANVEIRAAVGPEHFFLFGLTADEALDLQESGAYHPAEVLAAQPDPRAAVEALIEEPLALGDPHRFRPIYDSLVNADPYLVLADFTSYKATHRAAATAFQDEAHWTRSAILNVARCGRFSSDRSIREYARLVWGLEG